MERIKHNDLHRSLVLIKFHKAKNQAERILLKSLEGVRYLDKANEILKNTKDTSHKLNELIKEFREKYERYN
jgi:gas vesicle protein